MHLLSSVLILLAIALFVVAYIKSAPRGSQLIDLANVGEGQWTNNKTFVADTAVTSQWLLAKKGSAAGYAAIAAAADKPIGYYLFEGDVGEPLTVELFGITNKTAIGVASGVIAVDDLLVSDAAGKVRKLPVAAGSYWIIGTALSVTAADGDLVSYIPQAPVLRVVP